ncbi:MAG: hypothetical protein IPN63_07875 [Gammaproteobacteria bacterium]|nr:hypothetical protein [Gammaproteobacteria bacterium]
MSDGIKFFTAQLKYGEVAQFQLMTTAPWGMHYIRGAIIMSQATNTEAVVWPKCGRWFASSPSSREATDTAEKWILARLKEWRESK